MGIRAAGATKNSARYVHLAGLGSLEQSGYLVVRLRTHGGQMMPLSPTGIP
jgi:hypothetical protein